MNLEEYFAKLRTGDYQIDNFRSFLKKVGFSFKTPSIHISGTNGKGTTATYIASIYQNSGKKVGLFTSPFLYRINEMTTVNGEEIPDSFYEKTIKDNEKLIHKFELSPFEVQVFVSFKYFDTMNCDLCVIECGMGGEFDATNIFTPILSVITSVSLEHTAYLGRTISEIALHKAGIIKKEKPVVTGQLDEDAIKVVGDLTKELNCKLSSAVEPSNVRLQDDGYVFDYMTYRNVKINSRALYSVHDACIAIEAIEALKKDMPVSEEEILKGFESVNMNCRMSVVKTNPLIIIDGAHNPEGIANLSKSLQNLNISTPVHIVFSCFTDKNLQSMLSIIGEISNEITLTTFDNPRARGYEDYFLFAEDYKFVDNAVDAIKSIEEKFPGEAIVVTGSLAFAAYVKKMFDEGGF